MNILMKRIIIIVFLISSLFADEFIVKSFSILEKDLSARKEVQYDINGEACALIKIRTDINKTLSFDSNMGIPVAPIQKQTGEYWVYVAKGERALKCMAEEFIPKQIPLQGGGIIKSLTVYELILTSKNLQELSVEGDMYSLTFNMNTNNVYIQKDNSAKMLTTGSVAGYELPQGQYTFIFQKEGYKTHTEILTINSLIQKNIVLEKGMSDFEESLPGFVVIKSEPKGAEIYLNDKSIGVTTYQGELYEGNYDLRISKEFYHDEILRFSIKPKITTETPVVYLKQNYALLSINSEPENAQVYLNELLIGITPIRDYQAKSGLYKLTVKKELFLDYTEDIEIQDKIDLKRNNIRLSKNFGSFILDCKNVSNVNVYLDNNYIDQTPLRVDTLKCGEYELKVKKELYKDFIERIEIYPRENKKDMILLKNHGVLEVNAPECDIYLNNEIIGKNQLTKALLPGEYKLKAIMDDVHYPVEEKVYIGIGETKHFNPKPEYIQGSVSIVANPAEAAGAEIYVNKVLQDTKTPTILTLPIGTYMITLKHPDYLDNTRGPIHINENEYIQEQFDMKTYKGSLKEKENFWKKQKWLALGGTVLVGGLGGVGGHYMGYKKHDEYELATNYDDVIRLRKESEAFFLTRDISYGVSISSLIYTGIAWIQELRYKEYQKDGVGFLEKVFGSYLPKK